MNIERWEFRYGPSLVRVSGPSFYDAREIAYMMLGTNTVVWELTTKRVDAQVRWVGTDTGRIPNRHREVRVRDESGAWGEWETR